MPHRTPGEVVVFGAGGHAKVVGDIVSLLGGRTIAHVDLIDPTRHGESFMGAPVETVWRRAMDLLEDGAGAALAIGDNLAREAIHRRLASEGHAAITLVHPESLVSRNAVLEGGVVIGPRAVVNAGARIGRGAIVNTMALVEHDCRVREHAHVAPVAALAGSVDVGERAFVGIGARVRERCRIGAESVLGAGSVVVSDVPASATVCGVPARPIHRRAA